MNNNLIIFTSLIFILLGINFYDKIEYIKNFILQYLNINNIEEKIENDITASEDTLNIISELNTNKKVYLDISIDNIKNEKIIIELFSNKLPKTCNKRHGR